MYDCFDSIQACERLLAHRIETKLKTKKMSDVMNRLHVAMPAPRDKKVRITRLHVAMPAPRDKKVGITIIDLIHESITCSHASS